MSRAGTKSNQGDDYQRLVAMHWLIRLLNPEEHISYIQAESNGLPDIDEKITVDDVVVVYTDNRRRHVQAKKNQPQNRSWSLSDKALIDELPKIRDQLESSLDTVVALYSRTPFADFQSLADASREYPSINAFNRQSGNTLRAALAAVAKLGLMTSSTTQPGSKVNTRDVCSRGVARATLFCWLGRSTR